MTTRPHDALFKAAFETPEHAAGIFRDLLPASVRDAVAWETMVREAGDWAAAFSEAYRAPHGVQSLAQLIRYISLVTPELQFEAFRARLAEQAPETKEIAMTIAEQMHREGRAEGRVEGRVEGLRETLRKQLALKFGAIDAEHAARIEAASPEELDLFLERVLTAETLAAVFAE